MTSTNEELPELVIPMGLPRSGKSTWARQQGLPMVNPDSIRLAHQGHAFIKQTERFIWTSAHLQVESLFESGHRRVIMDATNTTRKRRDEWKSDKWRRRFVVFDTDMATCISRLTEENHSLEHIIVGMASELEPIAGDELEVGESTAQFTGGPYPLAGTGAIPDANATRCRTGKLVSFEFDTVEEAVTFYNQITKS